MSLLPAVRRRVAENENTPADILERLSYDVDLWLASVSYHFKDIRRGIVEIWRRLLVHLQCFSVLIVMEMLMSFGFSLNRVSSDPILLFSSESA